VSGGAGGAHAYWRLDQPQPATLTNKATGELVEPIERAHLRLIHHLGTDADRKPNVADPACADRSGVMRLAGSANGKTGAHARILEADLALRAYRIGDWLASCPTRSHRRRRVSTRPAPARICTSLKNCTRRTQIPSRRSGRENARLTRTSSSLVS
jgi:hypothetical protein